MKEAITLLAMALKKIIDDKRSESEKLLEIYEHLSDNDKVYLAKFLEMLTEPTTGEL